MDEYQPLFKTKYEVAKNIRIIKIKVCNSVALILLYFYRIEKKSKVMSTKQCEEKLKDKGVRPTAARILILQKLSEQTYPISLLELEAQLETLDKSTISRSLAPRRVLLKTGISISTVRFVTRPIVWII